MKKLVFILILLIGILGVPVSKAQTGAGAIMIGLSSGYNLVSGSDLMTIGFSSTKIKSNASGYVEPDPDKSIILNFIPKSGFFVFDNLAVGLTFTLAYSQSKDGENDNKSTQTFLVAGPFVRYYIPANKILPFIEGSVEFGSLKWKYEYESGGNIESKDAMHSFSGGCGVAARLGEKVTLDVMACYISMVMKSKDDNPDNERIISGAFGIKLGFIVFLRAR